MAGLPGTGLGGIFYVCLVVWMIVSESLKGRASKRARWATIASMSGFAAAIVAVLWIEGWLVKRAAESFELPSAVSASLMPAVAVLPLVILALLLLGLPLVRLWLGPADRSRLQPLPKAAARRAGTAVFVEASAEGVRERA